VRVSLYQLSVNTVTHIIPQTQRRYQQTHIKLCQSSDDITCARPTHVFSGKLALVLLQFWYCYALLFLRPDPVQDRRTDGRTDRPVMWPVRTAAQNVIVSPCVTAVVQMSRTLACRSHHSSHWTPAHCASIKALDDDLDL